MNGNIYFTQSQCHIYGAGIGHLSRNKIIYSIKMDVYAKISDEIVGVTVSCATRWD